jgi:hypothetical protein
MDSDRTTSNTGNDTIWKQLTHIARFQTELDESLKCMHIESAWKLWKERVDLERMMREQQYRKKKASN